MKNIEKRLLEVYKAENPSTYKIESDPKEFEYRKRFVSTLIEHRLKLPRQLFHGARLLEFGAGTGEHSLFYLKWGAKGTFVDFNDDALKRMRVLFETFSIDPSQYEIHHQSIYDFQAANRKWDIVLAMGLLHHLRDKESALDIVAECVQPGGFLVLGVSTMAGLFQVSLQRWAVRRLAGNDDARACEIAEQLFDEHISRSQRFGKRSRRAIIYDTYINPKIDGFGLKQLLQKLQSHGLTLYSSWPTHQSAAQGDSAYREDVDLVQTPEFLIFPELQWLSHRDDDIADMEAMRDQLSHVYTGITDLLNCGNQLNSMQLNVAEQTLEAIEKIQPQLKPELSPYTACVERTQILLSEAGAFIRAILDNDLETAAEISAHTDVLFKGTSGVGINYFVAHRAHSD